MGRPLYRLHNVLLPGAQALWPYLRRRCVPLRVCDNFVQALRQRSPWALLRLTVLVAGLLVLAPLVTWAFGPWRWLLFLGIAQSVAAVALGLLNSLRRRVWSFTTRTWNLRRYNSAPAVLASNSRSL
jgi:hypothetical protein